mgnify:CR=1 FL=1
MEGCPRPFFTSDPEESLGNLSLIFETNPFGTCAVYKALSLVKNDVENSISEPVPLHLRNAPTKLMEETGHGKGYKHAHNFQDAVTDMECLPESFRGRRYYVPTSRGIEERIAKRLDELRNVARRG